MCDVTTSGHGHTPTACCAKNPTRGAQPPQHKRTLRHAGTDFFAAPVPKKAPRGSRERVPGLVIISCRDNTGRASAMSESAADALMAKPTPQEAFALMLHDRLVETDKELLALTHRCDRQLPAILLPPYRMFDDGYELIWKLGEEPRMRAPGCDRTEYLDLRHGNAFLCEDVGQPVSFGREVLLRAEHLDDDDDPNEPYYVAQNILMPFREVTIERLIRHINGRMRGSWAGTYFGGWDWSLKLMGREGGRSKIILTPLPRS